MDVSVDVADGQVTGFVGPNGAGKTTLMRIVAGLTPADSGSATVDGRPFAASGCPASALGVCLAPDTLPPTMTGAGLLEYACGTQGLSRRVAVAGLRDVGLSEAGGKAIRSYSAGMRQRLAIALALVGSPRNLILDEPTNGLDMNGVRWLRDVLHAKAAEGAAVLVSSHILSELALVANNIVMIAAGSIIERGTVESLSQSRTESYVETPSREALMGALTQSGIASTREGGGLRVADDPLSVSRIAHKYGILLSHLSAVRHSLEEVYDHATGGGPDRR